MACMADVIGCVAWLLCLIVTGRSCLPVDQSPTEHGHVACTVPCRRDSGRSEPPAGSSESPICGSDGNLYKDVCSLLLESCRTGTSLTTEPIDTCLRADETKEESELMDISPVHSATFRAPHCSKFNWRGGTCPMIYNPVCSSEGVTYSNECLLCSKMRLRGRGSGRGGMIFIRHKGKCH